MIKMKILNFNEKDYEIIERMDAELFINVNCEKIIYKAKAEDGHINGQPRFIYKNLKTNEYFLMENFF